MKTLRFLPLFLLTLPALAGKSQQLATPDQVPEGLQKSEWRSIRAAHDGWKHQFHQVDGKWQANNPGQRWTIKFDGRGFLVQPMDTQWTWGLELESYGFGSNLCPVTGTPEIKAEGQRLSYRWQGGLEEWFVNDARGLEHGFTLDSRPGDAEDSVPLAFTLSTVGDLKPSVANDKQTVHFSDEAGAPVLSYSGLRVWDADGIVLPSRFQVIDSEVRLLVEESTARYPLTINPIAQQTYLKASNTGSNDWFGSSVAVSGDTVVVGADGEDSGTTGVNTTPDEGAADSGAAYVFVRSGTVWTQQAYLKASNTGADDRFGISVAVSGDTVVVGAYGEDSSTTGVNTTPNEGATDSGAVYVFVRSGTSWNQQSYLKASNAGEGDYFGDSVAVSGDTVVVGADYEDSSTTGVNGTPNEGAADSGAAYVFTRSGSTWSQQAYLKASNTGANDNFGLSIAISGDTVVVGADYEDSSTTGVNGTPNEGAADSGAAYVFTRSGSTWSQQAYLKASNTGVEDSFGWSVAVSGDTVVVGANYEDSSTTGVNGTPNEGAADSGAAYVFVRSGSTWSQQAFLKASNTGAEDYFGESIALSGDTVVVGADYEDSSTTGVNGTPNEGGVDSGAAYVFVRSGSTWSQQAYLKASNTGAEDGFGWSVAVSGDTVVVGAYYENSSTTGVNGTPNEGAADSGAVYIFAVTGPPSIALSTSSAITGSTATLGATVTSEGIAAITGRGIVYSVSSTNADPVIGGTGVTQFATSGTTGVFTVGVVSLAPGTTYSFKAYATNSKGTSYTPVNGFTTPPYVLNTLARNGTIQRNPDLASYPAGTVVTLTAVSSEGYAFQGWSGDLYGGNNPATVTMDGNKSVTAMFLPDLVGALDTPGRSYASGGDADWHSQTSVTHDGVDAARSGVVGHSQETWFETTVTGPGSLSFWWKVSSESGYDFLEFYIDGQLQAGHISGEVDWQQKTFDLSARKHVLSWRYVKDISDSYGSDAGWVDQVVWTPNDSWGEKTSMPARSGEGTLRYDASGNLHQVYVKRTKYQDVNKYFDQCVYRRWPAGGASWDLEEVVCEGQEVSYSSNSSFFPWNGISEARSVGVCLLADPSGQNIQVFTNLTGSLKRFERKKGTWSFKETVMVDGGSTSSECFLAEYGRDLSMHLVLITGVESLWHGRMDSQTNQWTWSEIVGNCWKNDEMDGRLESMYARPFSLAVGADDVAHVTYCAVRTETPVSGGSFISSDLRYASNRTGLWASELLAAPGTSPFPATGDAGLGANVAVGPNGVVGVAGFFLPRAGTGSPGAGFLYFRQRLPDGTWSYERIVGAADGYVTSEGNFGTGFAPDLEFAPDGAPHIAFSDHASKHLSGYGASSAIGQLRHAVKIGGKWSIVTRMVQRDPAHNYFLWPDLAVGPGGRVVFHGTVGTNLPPEDQSTLYAATASPYTLFVGTPEIAVEQPVGTNLTDASGSIDFGSQAVGSTGTPKSYTIRNTGVGNLTGIASTKNGTNAADFILNSNGMATTLVPGASTTFTVSFKPVAAGARVAAIHIASSDPDENPFSINLTGTGVLLPAIQLGGDLSFGPVAVGATARRTLSISNPGSGPLAVAGIVLPTGFTADWTSGVIAAGGKRDVGITFSPASLGGFGTVATVSSDASSGVGTIACTGTGSPDADGDRIPDQLDLAPNPLGTARVSGMVDFTIAGPAGATKYEVTALPAGLAFNATTGRTSGRPLKAGTYTIQYRGMSGGIWGVWQKVVLVVAPLPAHAQGAFTAFVGEESDPDLGNGLGGAVDLTVAPTGICTGKVRFFGLTYPFTGRIEADPGQTPVLRQSVVRIGLTPLALELEFGEDHRIEGTIDDGSGGTVQVYGWRHVWNAGTNPAWGGKDRTLHVAIGNTGTTGPGGQGFAVVKLAKSGLATWTGTLADGKTFTGSFMAGPDGEIPLWVPVAYPGGGSVHALLSTSINTDLLRVAPPSEANGNWIKRVSAILADRSYSSGFDVDLSIHGAEFRAPVAGRLLFGAGVLASAPSGLDWRMAGAGVDEVTALAGFADAGVVALPSQLLGSNGLAVQDITLAKVLRPAFVPSSGSLSATLAMTDTVGIVNVPRTLTMKGLYIPDPDDASNSRVVGFTQLAVLPGIGVAAASTAIISGDLRVRRTLDFGLVRDGTTARRTLTIPNTGVAVMEIGSVSCPSGFTVMPTGPVTVPVGASLEIVVNFSPTAELDYSGDIIVNRASGGSESIPCSGSGIVVPSTLLDLCTGGALSQGIPTGLDRFGTVLSVSGLPPGMSFNALARTINGRPTQPGYYSVAIAMRGTDLKVQTLLLPVSVEALPSWAVGSFTALVAVPDPLSALLPGRGGLVTLTSTATGLWTGKLRLGALEYPMRGQIEGVPSSVRGMNPLRTGATIIVNTADPTQNVNVNLEFQPEDHATTPGLTGSVTQGAAMMAVGPGWQHVWNSRTKPAWGGKERTLNVVMENTRASGPQGDGFAMIKLATSGVATWTGTLADGRTFTGSFTVSPDGDVPLYLPLAYPGGGCMTALLETSEANGLVRVDTPTDPNGRWGKLGSASLMDRSYRDGFDVILSVHGAQHVAPTTGQLLFGATTEPQAMDLEMSGAWVDAAGAFSPFASGGVVGLDSQLRAGNVLAVVQSGLAVKITPSFSAATGSFAASAAISDPVAGLAMPRTVAMKGLYIPDHDDPSASGVRGHFLLPELPAPGQSATTTLINSGKLWFGY